MVRLISMNIEVARPICSVIQPIYLRKINQAVVNLSTRFDHISHNSNQNYNQLCLMACFCEVMLTHI